MTVMTQRSDLKIDRSIVEFMEQDVLPLVNIESEYFWSEFAKLVAKFQPLNSELLAKRAELQQKIDDYHIHNKAAFNAQSYRDFLAEIGYLEAEPEAFTISTHGVDAELAQQAGPQLVVPITNARYALNAANARWGSLYDALYGTDVIPEDDGCARGASYNSARGERVISWAKSFLDGMCPLAGASHSDVVHYAIEAGMLVARTHMGQSYNLATPDLLVGYRGTLSAPTCLLLQHNQLHIELIIDREHAIGSQDGAGLADIILESALSTIMDCEDSVAAVDGEDKLLAYRNWFGLMNGSLSEEVVKGERILTRTLNTDREYFDLENDLFTLKGRSLMFVRNVGLLMTTPCVTTMDGQEVYEGLVDTVITSTIGMIDLQGKGRYKNSNEGSIYIVKPKMHGPEEVAFSDALFASTEQMLGLGEGSIKMGIMDEERRTSLNLKACIEAARGRVAFINTGFLDRTGDEIHTDMLAGPVVPKAQMKEQTWLNAYEALNVSAGVQTGFIGKAQIGKGMWPAPDNMAEMMRQKLAHPKSGANTAWVPSPTAATLHAIHYHHVNVRDLQEQLKEDRETSRDLLLTLPILEDPSALAQEDIIRELENNAQSILGYVVRWIDLGVGCSKVPDINNVGLMEDRATLRISSQHICNWLLHGICSEVQVEEALAKMALVVDTQNAHDPKYQAMTRSLGDSIAYQTARALIFDGQSQPSGYTEPLLHANRLKLKQRSTCEV